jgi:hypothetical protein
MNKEFRRMQQLAGLLTEVNIQPAYIGDASPIIPPDLKGALQRLEENWDWAFENGTSPNDDEPFADSVSWGEEWDEDIVSPEDQQIFKKYEGKKFVTNDFWDFKEHYTPSPKMPSNAYLTRIEMYPNNVTVEVPNLSEDLDLVCTGWFRRDGEYISTAKDINEVSITPSNIPRFTTGRTPMYGDTPDWDQTPDNANVRYIEYINYNSHKYNTIIYGHKQTDDMFVEPKNPNPIIFGIVIEGEQEEAFEEMMKYLQSNGIQYNMENFEDEEFYLSVSLDDLKKKQLFRK